MECCYIYLFFILYQVQVIMAFKRFFYWNIVDLQCRVCYNGFFFLYNLIRGSICYFLNLRQVTMFVLLMVWFIVWFIFGLFCLPP